MPEMRFAACWPDGVVGSYYSPSLVVHDYVASGATYALGDFVERMRAAMTIASQRVEQKYGVACPRAAATLAAIESKAREFRDQAGAAVRVTWLEASATTSETLPRAHQVEDPSRNRS